jgi:hypothetical protein
MTVSEGQPTLSVDPEASLRAELTGAIAAAQIDVANAIAELARSGADSAVLSNQGQALHQLQRTVGSANLGSLLALRSDVSIAAASASALANQMVTTATNAAAANANLSLAQRARANIEALGRDLFEKRVLDPYLQFASAEDEEAYRKRERERDEARMRALELRTPEGDRRANELIQDQLRDAGAHGADRSRDFANMVQQAKFVTADLQTAQQPQENVTARPSVDAIKGEQPTISDDGLGDILASLKAAGVTTPAIQAREAGHGVAMAASHPRDVSATVRGG